MQHLDNNKIDLAIDTAMDLLRSFGDVNPTLTQCRQYFEAMMPSATNVGAPVDTENMYGHRLPSEAQLPPTSSQHARSAAQNMPQRPAWRVPEAPDYETRNMGLFNVDQMMAEYPAELFSDATFGSFNFGALDPMIQM